jgi:transposase
MDKRKISSIRSVSSISHEERHEIIREFLKGKLTKTEIWLKYTGQAGEHGYILRWMRVFGYIGQAKKRRPKASYSINYPIMESKFDDLDKSELHRKIKELEKLLQDSKLREEGYRIMIENAERVYKIPIQKKGYTK